MAGKGDKPRNCHTQKFRKNYDNIEWGQKSQKKKKTSCKFLKKIVKYYK